VDGLIRAYNTAHSSVSTSSTSAGGSTSSSAVTPPPASADSIGRASTDSAATQDMDTQPSPSLAGPHPHATDSAVSTTPARAESSSPAPSPRPVEQGGDPPGDDAPEAAPCVSIFTTKMKETHERQKRHILGCLHVPSDIPHTVRDRFGRETLSRGTGRVECIWRHLRRIWPTQCSIQFGEDLATAYFGNWNWDRHVQVHPEFQYLPVHSTTFVYILSVHRIAEHLHMLSPFPALPQRKVTLLALLL
jgi:hypothetical protein